MPHGDIIFGNIDSDIVIFFNNSIMLNNANLNDDNFDDCDRKTINHFRIMTWYNRYKQNKGCKKR